MEVATARELIIHPTALPILVLVAGLTLFYVLRRQGSGNNGGLRLPPSPFALPVLGHFHLLAPLPHQAMHRLALRHGPLLYLRLGSTPAIAVCSPDAAREVLKTHEAAFLDRPMPTAVHRLTYGGQDFIFSAYGPYWRFMKRACVHELLAGRTLDRLRHVRRDEVSRLVAFLSRSAAAGAAVDVDAALMGVTGNVISRMLMSRRWTSGDSAAEEIGSLVAETAEVAGTINLQDYIGVFKHWDVQGLGKRVDAVHRKFDAMMERILTARDAERRRRRRKEAADGGGEGDKTDLLDMLLDMHEDEAAEMQLTRENIKAFVVDMFAAGTDTTAITLEWALSELINNPAVLQRAQAEVDAVVGASRLANESDIPRLPYLQAIAKETLRLHPTGPLAMRRSTEPCKVSGYDVPAGATVFVNVWAIGRDPASWAPDPLAFRPERFLEGESAELDVRGQHFHLLPFGSGRRICPGASLALLVVQAALAAMVQCFEWAPFGGTPVDMEEGPGLTLPRKHPLVCTVKARFDPLPAPIAVAAAADNGVEEETAELDGAPRFAAG